VVLAKRGADDRDRLAGHHFVTVSQFERLQVDFVRIDFEQANVGKWIEAEDLGRQDVAVIELDVDLFCPDPILAFTV